MASDSPASILYNNLGNAIGVIQDGYIYRLQVEAKLSSNNIDGYLINILTNQTNGSQHTIIDGYVQTNPNVIASGTITSNIGTTNGLALDSTLTNGTATTKITDGTHNVTVKAASTAAAATDNAMVVALSPNNTSSVKFGDSASVDAFGRIRTSDPYTLFESKQIIDNRPTIWSTLLTTNGTSTFNINRASSLLAVTSTIGSQVIRQTKPRFQYQPGKSLLIMNTCVFSATAGGIKKRVGYFDGYNGLFIQHDGYNLSFVVRSNVTGTPTDIIINQNSWNIDKFDGTGDSKIILDITKCQIFVIDMEWLGVGRVRFGFNINGILYYAHQVLNANNLSSVYISSPNLPLRYEITNVSSSSSSTLEQICSTVISEGGFDNKGYQFSADRGISVIASTSNAIVPLISIKLNNTLYGVNIGDISGVIFCNTSSANFRWQLVLNPNVAGTDAASWNTINNSGVEYDITRSTANTISGGTVLASGYGAQSTGPVSFNINSLLTLGIDLSNISDQLVLTVQKIDTGSDSFLGALNWREFV